MTASALDIAVRHQAYIEGVKDYTADEIDPTAEALAILLAALLIKWGYEKLGDMPKRELNKFAAEFNKQAEKLLTAFKNGFADTLKQIVRADKLITGMNFKALTGNDAVTPTTAAAFAAINNDIIPGTGHLPGALITDFVRSSKHQLGLLIKRAYAEQWTTAQIMQALSGTKAKNFKDGLLGKIKNQWNTVQQTLIQHVHQWFNYHLGKLYYDAYEWVSVLDANTTDVCRGRHGNVYRYGSGPRPPAHYNCRSTIVGIRGVEAFPVPPSFYTWVKGQPATIQDDLLGAAKARQLRAGALKSEGIPRFENARKIAPSDLIKYQPKMVK